MLGSAPPVEIRYPPPDLDALVDWFDRICYRLVLLEEYPLAEVVAAVDAFERGVRAHLASAPDEPGAERPPPAPPGAERTLGADHARFETSLEQLRWCLAVVQREDHGGHRQALGQYGRVLAEALRRHRNDERAIPSESARRPVAAAPGKP